VFHYGRVACVKKLSLLKRLNHIPHHPNVIQHYNCRQKLI
jgi:hypothetical protein